jgi:hypothetical protein
VTDIAPSRTSPPASAPETADHASKRRRALVGGVAGYFVDQFDIYLPVIVLAPAMGYFVPN